MIVYFVNILYTKGFVINRAFVIKFDMEVYITMFIFNNKNTKATFLYYIDNLRDKYIENSFDIQDNFCSEFYGLLAEFTAIDAELGFCSIFCRSNILKKQIKSMNTEKCIRFFKIMAMHHTIQMIAKKKDKLNFYIIKDYLYKVYEMKEDEKKLFELLYKCRMTFPRQFPAVFSKTAIKYIFGSEYKDIFAVAFFQNFCYNSFAVFVKYFSEYISINRRIKKSNTNQEKGA